MGDADTVAACGYIEFYTGTMPAKPESAPAGGNTKLGTCTCSITSGVVASGVYTFSAITMDSSADATGTATWARVRDGAGNACFDVDVSVTGGTGTVQMPTTSIVSGGPIAFNSFTIKFAPGAW
jgi:hypothetical protein